MYDEKIDKIKVTGKRRVDNIVIGYRYALSEKWMSHFKGFGTDVAGISMEWQIPLN